MYTLPHLMVGTVTAVDSDRYKAYVTLDGAAFGQGVAWPCDVLTHGPRDAVRGRYPALPTPGTKVLIGVPRNNIQNAVVIGSLQSTQVDATAGQAGGVGAHADYHAGWSGGWSYDAEGGQHATVYADGTQVLVGYSGAPELTRHTLDASQARQTTPFSQNERVPAPPGAFEVSLQHPTGASASVSAAGAITAQAANGQALTLIANGGTVVVTAGGDVHVTATGTAHVQAPAVDIDNGGTTQLLLNGTALEVFNLHTHGNVVNGSDHTNPPDQLMGSSSETSVLRAQ